MQMETDAARHETTTNWRQMKWEENYINWFEMTMKKNENKMKRKEIKRICVSSITDWRWHDYNWLALMAWMNYKKRVAVPKVASYLWPNNPVAGCLLAAQTRTHPRPLLWLSVCTPCACEHANAYVLSCQNFGLIQNLKRIENRPPPPEIWGWGSFQFGLLWWLQTVVRQILCRTAARPSL